MAIDLAKTAKAKGIKYFLISFTDLFGVMRSKLVPAPAIGGMARDGAGFAGFAAWLDMTPANSDLFAVPDPSSLIQLPWKPEVAWLASNLWMDGKEVEQAPRNTLVRVCNNALKKGYRLKTGVEPEFFFISEAGDELFDPRDTQEKPCYDQSILMRRYDVISEICDSMIKLGWGPYQNDHEDANGQYEINWDFNDAVVTADQHAFFKYMVKALAEKHGLRATFMPKPFAHLTGNGCHAHISVWDKSGKKNLFNDPKGELGVSKLGYQFMGGLMHNAVGMTALTNPTVNSYKRISGSATSSGATWAPTAVTYGGNNRTNMIRIPDAGRFEFRLADGAANPYLLQAALLAAGLEGVANKRDPGKRVDLNMFEEGHKVKGAKHLPLNLLDALRELEKNSTLRTVMGDEVIDAFLKLKHAEWRKFTADLTAWERENAIDC